MHIPFRDHRGEAFLPVAKACLEDVSSEVVREGPGVCVSTPGQQDVTFPAMATREQRL